MIQVARNERLDRANNCFNCSHTRCGVFVNVEQTRFAWPSRNIARSAFPGLRVKNISDNFKRFRPANLKGMPIGSLCARPIFPIFFAQTSRLPIPPKNHHYSASLRLINPRRSNRLFIAKANPPFPSLLPPSSNSDLFKNRNSHFVERGFEKAPSETRFSARKDVSLELDEQNPDQRGLNSPENTSSLKEHEAAAQRGEMKEQSVPSDPSRGRVVHLGQPRNCAACYLKERIWRRQRSSPFTYDFR